MWNNYGLDRRLTKANAIAGDSITLSAADLGFSPSQVFATLQINAEGLGGGAFTVSILVPGCASAKIHYAGALETDTVVIPSSVIYDAVVVSFAGVGAGTQTVACNTRRASF